MSFRADNGRGDRCRRNSRLVAQRAHQKIEEIQKRLPERIEIKTVYNRTDLVDRTIRTVEKNLIDGALLVIVILMLLHPYFTGMPIQLGG